MKTVLFLILTCISSNILFAEENEVLNNNYQIMFWDKTLDSDIKKISSLTAKELVISYKPYLVLTVDKIFEYYWDEQVFLIYSKYVFEHGYHLKATGVFTVFFNDKILFHGLNRTFQSPVVTEYDRSSFPIITMYSLNENYVAFYLIPVSSKWTLRFKEFSVSEKKKILNDDVYLFFKEKNKIVHGDCDKLFER